MKDKESGKIKSVIFIETKKRGRPIKANNVRSLKRLKKLNRIIRIENPNV